MVDRYDLYGKVAYPKHHRQDQIPAIYRWASNKRGLFVNPALTEPFGLTLLEAAACGLPIVSTDDGGPKDILYRCNNGMLVDVTDLEALQDTLEQAGSNQNEWMTWSNNGLEAISRYFSWDAHVSNYIGHMKKNIKISKKPTFYITDKQAKNSLGKKLLLLDLDSSLEAMTNKDLSLLRNVLQKSDSKKSHSIGILTGRSLSAARYRFGQLNLPDPFVWICRAGTEIYYQSDNQPDQGWQSAIDNNWDRESVMNALSNLTDHLQLQELDQQSLFKVSYLLKEPSDTILPLIRKRLRHHGCSALPHLRCHWYLDVVPLRASRSEAIRYLSLRWDLFLEQIFVVASQQGDGELVRGLTTTLIPKDHDPSLNKLRSNTRVYFAPYSRDGVINEFNQYSFFLNE